MCHGTICAVLLFWQIELEPISESSNLIVMNFGVISHIKIYFGTCGLELKSQHVFQAPPFSSYFSNTVFQIV